MLELRELVKHYNVGEGERVRAVDGLTMSVAAGELVALYGPSGSGKSTLLMLIAALLRPDGGTIRVGDREISSLSEHDGARYRLRDLGFIRQSVSLVPGVSALDNAALKLLGTDLNRRQAHRRVSPLLEQLGLGGRLHHCPDQLSMGERQRVMIARALSTGPKLVLADEPTGSLDSRRGREVLELLAAICHERLIPVLLVTHDPRAATFADRAHVLHDGRLVDHEPALDSALDSALDPVETR
ncbi:MAG TPA: ABC transporter ATP-binding protein [Solirubrobacteraceae bacterium]|nr:ABC transporter ATP-binding protein [Solirubrobacteraceae bacterium]